MLTCSECHSYLLVVLGFKLRQIDLGDRLFQVQFSNERSVVIVCSLRTYTPYVLLCERCIMHIRSHEVSNHYFYQGELEKIWCRRK